MAQYRTQLIDPADIDKVKKIQASYKAEPLSAFLGQPAPAAAPKIDFIKPLTKAEEETSLEFFDILNFNLNYAPTVPSEVELMVRFAKIGVGPGQKFDAASLSAEMKTAIEKGMADGMAEFVEFKKQKIDTGKVTSGDLLGTRAFLKNNYLYRMSAAILGIYWNTKQEAMDPVFTLDEKVRSSMG